MHIQPQSESKPNKISRILSSDLRGLRIRHFYYKQITKYCQVLWNTFGLVNKSMKAAVTHDSKSAIIFTLEVISRSFQIDER